MRLAKLMLLTLVLVLFEQAYATAQHMPDFDAPIPPPPPRVVTDERALSLIAAFSNDEDAERDAFKQFRLKLFDVSDGQLGSSGWLIARESALNILAVRERERHDQGELALLAFKSSPRRFPDVERLREIAMQEAEEITNSEHYVTEALSDLLSK